MPKSFGTVKMFAADKGFGFINVEGSRDSVFFHISAFKSQQGSEPEQGLPVQFEMSEGKDKSGTNKPQAIRVTPADDPVEDAAFISAQRREYIPDRNAQSGNTSRGGGYGSSQDRGGYSDRNKDRRY